MNKWWLVYYVTAAGRCPVKEYIDDLNDHEEAEHVTTDLDLLEDLDLSLGATHLRQVRGKLWELRSRRKNEHRILYFTTTGRQLILLHAFTKKTQKTPKNEIETAMRRMKDYREGEERQQ